MRSSVRRAARALSPLRGRRGSQTFQGTSPEPQSRAQTRTACTLTSQAPSPAKPIPALAWARVEETSLPGSAAIVVGAPAYKTHVAASLAPEPEGKPLSRTARAGTNACFPFGKPRKATGHASTAKQNLRTASPTAQCASRGTLLHVGLQGSRLYTCYSHQDLH